MNRDVPTIPLQKKPQPVPSVTASTLDRMPRGARVRVLSVDVPGQAEGGAVGAGGDPIVRRLDDLGIRQGVEVEVIRRAPLGDPTVFELHGYQLCLRRSESERVRVEPSPGPSAAS